jgi:beta-lactamase regulating signal transducer with metallopeptidase domain
MSLALLSDPLWQRVALALVHFIWQGAAIGALLWMTLVFLHTANARYFAALAALLLMAMCPIGTILLLPLPVGEGRGEGIVPSEEMALLAGEINPHPSPLPQPEGTGFRFEQLQPYIIAAWLLGVTVLGLRLLISYLGVRRLRASSAPLEARALAMFHTLARRMRVSGNVRAAASKVARDALVIGLWRPLVLIPAAWITEMPPQMLEAVLAHELAHIRRHDLVINLFQRVLETLLFYHPAVWYASRVLRQEREKCCDELAVAATGERLAYVEALQLVAHRRLAASPSIWAAAMGGARTMNLLERVRNVLGLRQEATAARFWPVGLAALALPAGLWCATLAMTPAAHADDKPLAEESRNEEARGVPVLEDIPLLGRLFVIDEDADDAKYLRRTYLDITGTIPTADEIRVFVADEDSNKRVKVVDRLIAQAAREGERREGDRPREGAREGERREGDRPREGDRRPEARREGDRPAQREGERREGDRSRDPGAREGERRPNPELSPREREMMQLIQSLRGEVEALRREMNELRGSRGGRPEAGREGDRPRPDAERPREGGREGDRPRAEKPRPRDGERRPEGDRPREGEHRPEGDRPRDGERRPMPDRPRDGERPNPERRGEGERPREDRASIERLNELLRALANAKDEDAERIRAEINRMLPSLSVRGQADEIRRQRQDLEAAEQQQRLLAERERAQAIRAKEEALRKAKEDIDAERKRLIELELELQIKPQQR